MDFLRLDTLAGHLVDWHNRRFWARRITVAHVQSMGYVVLPLVDPAGSAALPVLMDVAPSGPDAAADGATGATLRERAMARAQQGAAAAEAAPAATAVAAAPAAAPASPAAALLKAAFSEDFIPPLKAAAVATFASRHGAAHAQPGKDAQVRQVLADAAAERGLHQRWLLTAQIQVGRSRTRVLVGSGLSPAVLGRRLPNTPLLALGLALLVAAAGAGWALMRAPAGAASAAAGAAAATAAAASAASAAAVASASEAATVPAPAPASASAPASAAERATASDSMNAVSVMPTSNGTRCFTTRLAV